MLRTIGQILLIAAFSILGGAAVQYATTEFAPPPKHLVVESLTVRTAGEDGIVSIHAGNGMAGVWVRHGRTGHGTASGLFARKEWAAAFAIGPTWPNDQATFNIAIASNEEGPFVQFGDPATGKCSFLSKGTE